jgi:uncharacterized protein (TIGR02266 family)
MDLNQESRLHPRVPFVSKVSVIPTGTNTPLKLWATDLSEGGLGLRTDHPFRRGDRVGLRLDAPGQDIAIPVAEVAWVLRSTKGSSRRPGIGLRFVDVDQADRKVLRKVVSARAGAEPNATEPPESPLVDTRVTDPGLPPHLGPMMATEPPLPPPGIPIPRGSQPDDISKLPPDLSALSGPSLGPLPSDAAHWEFSRDGLRASMAPLARSSGFGLAAVLLVAGTVTGLVFGVLNQSGKPKVESQPQAAVTPVATATAAAEPSLAPASAPAAAPVAEVTKTPATPKPVVLPAARVNSVESLVSSPPPAPRVTVAKAAPGRFSVGTPAARGKETLVPIQGARRLERHFFLDGPPRVVVDLATDTYDGPKELQGRGAVSRIRVGQRPGGVRLVLEVPNAKVAKGYKVSGAQGNLTVALASR